MTPNPDVIIGQIAQGRGVKLGKGVVGKTGHAILLLLGIWGFTIWRMGGQPWWLCAMLLFADLAATAVFIWWVRSTQSFAERNPAQAMLEGAEFLEYKRFEAAAKRDDVIVIAGKDEPAGLSAPPNKVPPRSNRGGRK